MLALQWWRQYPTGIPFHAVARGLRLSYTALRECIARQSIALIRCEEEPAGRIAVLDAHLLLEECYGISIAQLTDGDER
jgi:hypothetical protein